MKSFTFIIYSLWTGEFWVVNIGVWCLHNGYIVVYLCCIIEIFVISCRKSWQARGAGEAGGQVFRGGVIHGVWNGLCYKLHEYSCADGKSKGITISSNIKSNGMLLISFSLQNKAGWEGTLGFGRYVFVLLLKYSQRPYLFLDRFLWLTLVFCHVTCSWKPLCFRMYTHIPGFIHKRFD